jgi:hypothetical protein
MEADVAQVCEAAVDGADIHPPAARGEFEPLLVLGLALIVLVVSQLVVLAEYGAGVLVALEGSQVLLEGQQLLVRDPQVGLGRRDHGQPGVGQAGPGRGALLGRRHQHELQELGQGAGLLHADAVLLDEEADQAD